MRHIHRVVGAVSTGLAVRTGAGMSNSGRKSLLAGDNLPSPPHASRSEAHHPAAGAATPSLIPLRAHPGTALLVGRQDHTHLLGMDRCDDRVRRRGHEAIETDKVGAWDPFRLRAAITVERRPDAAECRAYQSGWRPWSQYLGPTAARRSGSSPHNSSFLVDDPVLLQLSRWGRVRRRSASLD
jgi:hypothetical protein